MARPDEFERFASTDAVRADLKNKSIRSAIFFASGSGADLVLRFVSIAILARLVLPEDFGLIAMVAALTGMVDGFRDLGLSVATVQRAQISQPQVTNLFWVNASVGVIFAGVLTLLAPYIAEFYQEGALVNIATTLSLVFLWSGLAVQHEALLSRQLRQGELAAIRLMAAVISTLIAILLALNDFGVWALVWREVSRSALVTVGVWMRCPWRPGLPRRNVGTRSLMRFGGEISLTNLFGGLIANVDKILIGRFHGAAPLGMYRQAQQLLLAPIEQLNAPILSVAQPALSALQAQPDRYRKYYEKIVFLVALGTFPLGLFVAIYAVEITLLMLGPAWRDAAVFVRIFGVAAMIRPVIGTSAVVLVTCGLSTRFLVLAVIHGAVLTALLFAGMRWGAAGVALAHVAATVLLMVPKLHFSFVGTPVSLRGFASAAKGPLIAGTCMAAGLSAFRAAVPMDGVVAPLLVGAALAAVLYTTTIVLHGGSRAELAALAADIRAALRRRIGNESET